MSRQQIVVYIQEGIVEVAFTNVADIDVIVLQEDDWYDPPLSASDATIEPICACKYHVLANPEEWLHEQMRREQEDSEWDRSCLPHGEGIS